MPKLVLLLRVKDGIFFVQDWLNCFEKLVDEIYVVDNGSTDGTFEALKAHPKVIEIVQTEGFDEGRDKNLVYDLARKGKPDWLLWLDVDEIFEPGLTRDDLNRLMNRKHVNQFAFRRYHFIDKEYFALSSYWFVRTSSHDRMMWRESPKGYFEKVIIDSPNVKGIRGITVYTSYRLKHLGYINKDIVDRKAGIYRAILPQAEQHFQKMYMKENRKWRWTDNRKSLNNISMNSFLSIVQFALLFKKGPYKLYNIIFKK